MVSVIIPNYCHAKYLRERIDSVLAQTYKDFEVIILDDCSTDESREVIESYRGREHVAHIVYNEQNSGSPFKQWQKGVSLASGEYIWIAESDDVAYDTLLEECVKALDANKRASLAFVDCEYIDEKSNHTGFTHLSRRLACYRKGNTTMDGNRFVARRMVFQNYVMNASMAVFRKDALPKDDYYSTFHYCGDWLFWGEVALGHDVVYINKPLNKFRRHATCTTWQGVKDFNNLVEWRRLVERLLDDCKASNSYRAYALGKYQLRVKRHINRIGCDNGSYERWVADIEHPLRNIIWYRLAKYWYYMVG
ncbi:MAG: glycosyltransferase [Alistipes sp.]|nr:glycosyltransferase [Alistipes sp.]